MLIGIAVLTVWVPRVVGQAVDGLVAGTLHGAALARELVMLVMMGLIIYLLRVGWRLQLFSAAYQLGVELRTRLYDRLTLQGPPFFNRSRTGDLMARATNDVDSIEMAAGEAFLAGFDGTLTLILVIAMMALGIDWRLALIALLPFPLMAIAFWFISRRVHSAWRDSLDRFSNLNDHVQETIAGVRTLRALGLESQAARDFAQRAAAAAAANLSALKWEAAYEPAVGFTLTAATALTLGVGGWLVWQQQLTVGELTSFAMYLSQLIWPMFAAGWVLSLLERGKAGWTRLQPTLSEPLSVADHGTVAELAPGALRFEGVTFRYRSDAAPAVDDVSFELRAGQTLGIVGPTGSGKSTLLVLLLRHYAPDQGRIAWSGHGIDDYALRDAARCDQLGAAGGVSVFGNAGRKHRACAQRRDTCGDRTCRTAGGAARRHRTLPARLRNDGGRARHHAVGRSAAESGNRARAADRNATAAARRCVVCSGHGTETQILAHLRGELSATSRRTAIIVSHRLSAVARRRQIIVMKAGRIVERGSHEQLLVSTAGTQRSGAISSWRPAWKAHDG